MVLQTWIVPEPNPALSLSISNIDYRKLDHDDCRWIYSSTMKKYHREFSELQGFITYAQRLFAMEDLRKNNKYIIHADLNNDLSVNVVDVVMLVNIILGD